MLNNCSYSRHSLEASFCDECKCFVCSECDCTVFHLSYQEQLWRELTETEVRWGTCGAAAFFSGPFMIAFFCALSFALAVELVPVRFCFPGSCSTAACRGGSAALGGRCFRPCAALVLHLHNRRALVHCGHSHVPAGA